MKPRECMTTMGGKKDFQYSMFCLRKYMLVKVLQKKLFITLLVHTVDAKFAPLWILQRQKTTSAFSIFVWLCLKNDKHTDSPKRQENLSSTHIANV